MDFYWFCYKPRKILQNDHAIGCVIDSKSDDGWFIVLFWGYKKKTTNTMIVGHKWIYVS